MFYQDPMQVTCPSCGHETSCKVSDLFALRARCATCATALDELGHRMRHGSNQSRVAYIKIETVIALEDRLGVEIDLTDSPDDATVREFIAAVAELTGRDRDDAELTGWVIESMARLAERPLSVADLDRAGLALFAVFPDEVAPERGAGG